jgi:hypothetical protein
MKNNIFYNPSSGEVILIGSDPTTSWEIGDVIIGQSSGVTATVVAKYGEYRYSISGRSGTFSSGEMLYVSGDVSKNAASTPGYPQILTEQEGRFSELLSIITFNSFFRMNFNFSGTIGVAPDLWECDFNGTLYSNDAFYGNSTSSLSNYNSIPSAWR